MLRVFSAKAEATKRLRLILFSEARALASESISSGKVTLILENPRVNFLQNATGD
jgi:hypothetical protein